MRLPASLTSRLVLTSVGLVALVGLLVSVVTLLGMRAVLTERLDQDVRASADRLFGAALGEGGPSRPDPGLGDHGPFGDAGTVQAVIAPDGLDSSGVHVTRDGEREPLADAGLEALADVPADGDVHGVSVPGLGSYRVVATELQSSGGRVTVVGGLPTAEVDDTLSTLMWWELGLTLLGIGLAFAGGLALVRRTLRPLREVAAVAHQVTGLPLDRGSVGETVRVPQRLTDEATEVGQVGASLNSLLGHVEQALDARHRSEQQVRQFVADASHELRTPLTTIRGYAELGGRDPSVLATSMAKVSGESERMTALVDDLLLLARLDAGRPIASDRVDLSRLVIGAVDDARVVDPTRTWSLTLPAEPVVVPGDEQRLHQVVTNLLGNARRHTPSGTGVTTGLAIENGHVLLSVHDTGPGLPPGVDVFERFARGDSSRTRASGGAGLGLSLVAAIVGAHHGAVSVVSMPGDTTFTVTLPT